MRLTTSLLIVFLLLSTKVSFSQRNFSQGNDLGALFAKRYLNVAFGKISSASQTTYSTNPSSGYPTTVVWDFSFTLGFGYDLDFIRPNLFFEYNLSNNRYWNLTVHQPRHRQQIQYTYMRTFHWVHDLGLRQYIPIYKNRLYLSPFAGFNFTFSRAQRPGSRYSYDGTEDHWFRYTSARVKPGIFGGMGLNYRIGKRLLLFGQYKFQSQFSNNINLGEIKYTTMNGVLIDEFKSKVKPYNHSISLGISISLENSAFYK